jgi:hypothetical protein
MDDSIEVLTCKPVDMISEYRAIILDGEILDVRRYKGDWGVVIDSDTVKAAVNDFEASGEAPVAYTLDFALCNRGFGGANTILVEANDGYAFGNYGLNAEDYVSCLAARWAELTK